MFEEDAMEAGVPAAYGGRDGVGDAVAEQGRVLQQHAHPRAAATCKKKEGSSVVQESEIAQPSHRNEWDLLLLAHRESF